MKSLNRLMFIACTFVLVGATLIGLVPALAGPSTQDGPNIPTPTPFPVENVSYDLSVVGGQSETLTFPGMEADGITVGETTAVSEYPRGMVFRVKAESVNGDITRATLFIRYAHGSGDRAQATFDSATEEWVAHAWEGGAGQPAWTHFNFYWSIIDASNVGIETEPQAAVYSDPTREWYRVDTEYLTFYWFGTEETPPEEIAERVAYVISSTEPRRIAGFGGPLSYKPIGVAYPTYETYGEMSGSGIANPNTAGYTSTNLGMTIQNFSMPTDSWFESLSECIYLTPREERTEEFRIKGLIEGTIAHEVTHLYQFEYGGTISSLWWSEGQAEYFGFAPGTYDNRLRHLATLQDIASLRGDNIGASFTEADGCYALAYDVGVSFINWLLTNYGGIETHHRIVELYWHEGLTLIPAIETATGQTFFDLENGWRTYLGFPALSMADVDPASALQEPINPAFVEGDTVTLTSPRPQAMADNPGPNQLSNIACFPGTTVEILRVGSLDGINYYLVDCQGSQGWMVAEQLN